MKHTKIYNHRSSATRELSKMGVIPNEYKYFIEKRRDGKFKCLVIAAEMHLRQEAKKKQINCKVIPFHTIKK